MHKTTELELERRHMHRELRGLLKIHDISQSRLADIIGCKLTACNQKLSGKRDFKVAEVKKIAKHFDLTPEQIYSMFVKEEK